MSGKVYANRRINGLDTLRAAAIALVLVYHYQVVVSYQPTFGVLGNIGWIGVDLFFVLSGFLIGNQILAPFARSEAFSLKHFFARRLLRTLPNYYVILAAYLLVPALAEPNTASIWRFLSFTQNIGLHYGETFTHSWSLCIEEQFYVVLPIAVMLIAGLTKSVRVGWAAMIVAVVAGIAVRGMAWWAHGQNQMTPMDYSAHIYYSSFARADELLFGVAIATLKNFHGELYQKLQRHGNLILVAGLLSAIVICALFLNYQIVDNSYTFAISTYGYSALAASFALLTLAALSPNSWLNRIRIPGAEKFALWSYAIYLAHKPVFKLLRVQMVQWHIDINAPLGIAIIMFAGILAGWILYRLVESPFMALRQRWFPTNRAEDTKATALPAYP